MDSLASPEDPRAGRLRGPLAPHMRLIEIGPSHNPIAPKARGWNTTVVDHADTETIHAKYRDLGQDVSRVEETDVVWAGGALHQAFSSEDFGQYDGLIASHVGEHIPDLIRFFESATVLLKPEGVMALALPDRRYCFNFFQPWTLTGDVLAAYYERRQRHMTRTVFNERAYNVVLNEHMGWTPQPGHFRFTDGLGKAMADANAVVDGDASAPYQDYHCWYFTPANFELIMLELNYLRLIDWWPRAFERLPGVEFFVWLERRKLDFGHEADFNAKRMRLLRAMVREQSEQIDQLDAIAQPDDIIRRP